MTEANTIEVAQDNSTENYEVYESADGDTIVGMYVESGIAETLGEFASVTISDADDADESATADKSKDTSNYGVYELPPAITGMYVSHDALESETAEDADSPSAPENIGLALAPSDEETFESSLPDLDDQSDALISGDDSDEEESEPSAEEQAEALVAGADGESESESEADADDSDDEDVEIADDEIGL